MRQCIGVINFNWVSLPTERKNFILSLPKIDPSNTYGFYGIVVSVIDAFSSSGRYVPSIAMCLWLLCQSGDIPLQSLGVDHRIEVRFAFVRVQAFEKEIYLRVIYTSQ